MSTADGTARATPDPSRDVVPVLFGSLRVGEDLGDGWTLADVAGGRVLRLEIAKDGAAVHVRVRPAADGLPAYRSTSRFSIGYRGDVLPDPTAERALQRIVALVRENEARIPDAVYDALVTAPPADDGDDDVAGGDLRDGDLHWFAVRAGLKPACRQLFTADKVQRAIARAKAAGLHVECLSATEYAAGWIEVDNRAATGDTLVYVAATAGAARAARDAERALAEACLDARTPRARGRGGWIARRFARRREASTERQDAALGRALGYPECCVDFFLPRASWVSEQLAVETSARTRGPGSFLLNNIEMDGAFIQYYLCRYDCPASLRYARALFEALRAVNPERATRLATALHGIAILFRAGGYIRLQGSPDASGRTAVAKRSWFGSWPDQAEWLEAAQQGDAVSLDAERVRFLRGGSVVRELALPPSTGLAQVFT